MKVSELLSESVKEISPKTKKVFTKLAKLIKTEPLKNNFNVRDTGDWGIRLFASDFDPEHGDGFLIFTGESFKNQKIKEIFLYDANLKKWIHTAQWDPFTASDVLKFGKRYYTEGGWVDIRPKNNQLLKEENESIPRDIRRAAMHAGYDVNSKELRTMNGLKVAYAKRAIESDYADQFDAKLGELLGMIDMNEKQLKDFIKNNG